jgi:hypothetical protein
MFSAFLFPRVWVAAEKAHINAPPELVYSMIAEASDHAAWNPYFTSAEIKEDGDDTLIGYVEGTRGSGTLTLNIEEREPLKEVTATLDDESGDPGEHAWRFEQVGSGVDVRWTAEGTRRRNFIGRFANLAVSAWVSKQLEDGLAALKAEAERRVIE